MQELLQKYGNRLHQDDDIFTNILQIALLTSMLDVATDAVNRRFGTDNWFRVSFEQRNPARVHVLGLHISGRSSALFPIHDQVRISDRLDVVIGRWIAVLHILASYYHQEEIETGDIKINVGDDWETPALCILREPARLLFDPRPVLTS